MTNYEAGGLILILLAVINTALRLYLLRTGRVTRRRALPGLFAAVGFVLLGVVYATGMANRWPAAPAVALALAAGGFAGGVVLGRRDPGNPGQP